MNLPPLLLLTDRSQLPAGRSLERAVAECASAGLAVVVLRELDLPEPERASLAAQLARHVTVIAARTLLPATAGVHLAAHQPVVAARHGRSCHDESQLRQAVSGGAAWVTPVAGRGLAVQAGLRPGPRHRRRGQAGPRGRRGAGLRTRRDRRDQRR
ncbi:hypothetical protein GCM10009562_06000 [Nocardioides aquaticus]